MYDEDGHIAGLQARGNVEGLGRHPTVSPITSRKCLRAPAQPINPANRFKTDSMDEGPEIKMSFDI